MEITARELSYKNLINHKELGTVEVVGFNEEIIQYLHLDTIYYDEYSKLEAIKLTEEWLLKFGCIEQKISSFKSNFWNKDLDFSVDVNYYENGKSKVFQYLVNNQQRKKQILYVHKLQNLHFELKDTELTITK